MADMIFRGPALASRCSHIKTVTLKVDECEGMGGEKKKDRRDKK